MAEYPITGFAKLFEGFLILVTQNTSNQSLKIPLFIEIATIIQKGTSKLINKTPVIQNIKLNNIPKKSQIKLFTLPKKNLHKNTFNFFHSHIA